MRYSPVSNSLSYSATNQNRNIKNSIKPVEKNFKVLGILFTVLIIMTVLIFSIESKVGSTEIIGTDNYIQVTVKHGDTLWSLAKEHGPVDEDIRKICYDIRETNNMDNNILIPGQVILIPKSV